MTDRNEMNENNELNEQELEQAAGGLVYEKSDGEITVIYRCPKCGATKKVKTRVGLKPYALKCPNCLLVRMEEE